MKISNVIFFHQYKQRGNITTPKTHPYARLTKSVTRNTKKRKSKQNKIKIERKRAFIVLYESVAPNKIHQVERLMKET